MMPNFNSNVISRGVFYKILVAILNFHKVSRVTRLDFMFMSIHGHVIWTALSLHDNFPDELQKKKLWSDNGKTKSSISTEIPSWPTVLPYIPPVVRWVINNYFSLRYEYHHSAETQETSSVGPRASEIQLF